MQIDLKNPSELTVENVRRLLASKDDSQHRQLRVTTDGIAYLSDAVGNTNLAGIHCCFETWDPGNGYCGAAAAADDAWVMSVYNDLKANWPKLQRDAYVD